MRNLSDLKDFEALKIFIASTQDILGWSFGEVTKPETINYRTFKPERDGLFDERIFGPVKDFQCYCGKYKGYRYKGVICDKCGVEVAPSRVRRERMGHIKLASPVVHVWFFKGIPSKLATLLDITPRSLESVIYFSSFIVTAFDGNKKAEAISSIQKDLEENKKALEKELDKEVAQLEKTTKSEIKNSHDEFVSQEAELKSKQRIQISKDSYAQKMEDFEKQSNILQKKIEGIELHSILSDVEYLQLAEYVDMFCEVSIGADAVKTILEELDLDALSAELYSMLERYKGQKALKISKRLRVVEGFRRADLTPSRMVLEVLPVIPPELRPMVQLEGGRFATSDANDLYRRVINRNNRLKKLLDLGAPEIIIRNEKRMLQESVDALIDSSKQRNPARTARGRKQLKSLADQLKGKQGRFRANLLGKRVDYSGRGVIVGGPHLKLNECGIPKDMALELFKPFVLRELLTRGIAPNVKSAKFIVESRTADVWDILEELVVNHPVLLNRQPTLWRLGIQAFYPKLIEGSAIRLHLCVCAGYNADFDGDQMAVLLPLSEAALEEARTKMISTNNLRRPSDGIPFSVPAKITLFGIYFMTSLDKSLPLYERVFANKEEVYFAYNALKLVGLRQSIKVYFKDLGEIVETTVGRLLFNDILPKSFEYKNEALDKTKVGKIFEKAFETESIDEVAKLVDGIKDLGLKYGTRSGHSISLTDVDIPQEREQILNEAKKQVAEVSQNYNRGLITQKESQRLSELIWNKVTTDMEQLVWDSIPENNSIRLLLDSKASRASKSQLNQIGGIRGLVFDATGKIVNVPIIGNYKMGLSAMEYFIGARGTRKVLIDKGLKTADAGYLTRKLVDVAQEVLVREDDCQTQDGRIIKVGENTLLTTFANRYAGRFLAKDVVVDGKVLFKRDHLLSSNDLATIEKAKIEKIFVRSPLECEATRGVCSKCYGIDLMTQKPVEIGVSVGVTAAQSIGEPGTQLTLNAFHKGGVVGKDLTQGLPRVEELVEARAPKYISVMADVSGTVKVYKSGDEKKILLTASDETEEKQTYEYLVDPVSDIIVEDGQTVAKGEKLTDGHLNLSSLLEVVGPGETKKYIIDEVQKVYASQGIDINDKHLEVIVKQMFNHVLVEDTGDTHFLPKEIVTKDSFEEENKRVVAEGGEPAIASTTLLGITKASLNTDSFLSAASFIQTSQVLTDAAASGKVDMLLGLKENVILGRLIPTGDKAVLE